LNICEELLEKRKLRQDKVAVFLAWRSSQGSKSFFLAVCEVKS
jgi:hypothetical protein